MDHHLATAVVNLLDDVGQLSRRDVQVTVADPATVLQVLGHVVRVLEGNGGRPANSTIPEHLDTGDDELWLGVLSERVVQIEATERVITADVVVEDVQVATDHDLPGVVELPERLELVRLDAGHAGGGRPSLEQLFLAGAHSIEVRCRSLEKVSVGVDETGDDGPTFHVDHAGIGPHPGKDLVVATHSRYVAIGHGQGIDYFPVRVHRHHPGVVDDQVGRFSRRYGRLGCRCRGRCDTGGGRR